MIRVLVVEHRPLMQEILAEALNADAGIFVAGTARNEHDAVRYAEERDFDVITMNAHLPEKSGIEATRRIMAVRPHPIIAIHARWTEGDGENVRQILEAGAVASVEMTMGAGKFESDEFAERLRLEVKQAAAGRRGDG